ncbi:hypothetical protein [Bacillus sp. V59.32b]|uniref:hypothetical protein n=1 Tax=Bacillus sp. V59.32b TaxID=1758642 RepID=UPI000E3DAF55|nr:hypothetical protein [Bacillus sp. V59.32b]RFU68667.1 hypothetical protein D0463_04295 [Bacillus sp. V59.32b]
MKKFIEIIFGKPYTESKWMLFAYWFGIVFYFIAIIVFIIQSVIYGNWAAILFPVIAFPILFRIVYNLNAFIVKRMKGINTRLLLIIGILLGLLMVGVITVAMLFGENVVMNANKKITNGNLHLSIGSLKGHYEVEAFETSDDGIVSIPYEATIGDGDVSLAIKRSDDMVWEKTVSPSDTVRSNSLV